MNAFRDLLRTLPVLIGLAGCATDSIREAPNLTALPADQLAVAGNACGPAALLNAFRFGSPSWQRVAEAIPGDTDRAKIVSMIRQRGVRPSRHLRGHSRWSSRGVSVADLGDMAREMTAGHYVPDVREEMLFARPGETEPQLLRRVHRGLEQSLSKGFPPVMSIRRYVKRSGQWALLEAHFVTVVVAPRRLSGDASAFTVDYLDPWGGRKCQGRVTLPQAPFATNAAGRIACMMADFPEAKVGKERLNAGEESILVVTAILGRI